MPYLNEAVSLISAEESKRGVMLEPCAADNYTLASKDIKPLKESNLNENSIKGENRDSVYLLQKATTHQKKCQKFHDKLTTSSKDQGYKKTRRQAHMVYTKKNEDLTDLKVEIQHLRVRLEP